MREIANQRFQFLPGAMVFTRPGSRRAPIHSNLSLGGRLDEELSPKQYQVQLGKWRNPQTYVDVAEYTPFSEERDECIQILLADRRTS